MISSIIQNDWETICTSLSVADIEPVVGSNEVALILPSTLRITCGVSNIIDCAIALVNYLVYLIASNVSSNWVVLAIDGNLK